MSGDVAKRGQYAEIKKTENRPPFLEWWQNSLDIISCWNDINMYRESLKVKAVEFIYTKYEEYE